MTQEFPKPDTLDLGQFDAPALIFGGTFSNLEATQAVLAEAARRGIPAGRLICTGDIVATCADPQATIDCLRDAGLYVVRGNCEESIGFDRDDCGCGFDEGSTCDLLSAQWFRYARTHVDQASKSWLATRPGRIDFKMAGRSFAVIHGAVSAINKFVFPSASDDELAKELDLAATDAVVGGHSGSPFARLVGPRLWLNAGVVGMPANDGTPRVWYAVIAPSGDGIEVEISPLDYDHRMAVRKMRDRGLAGGYADSLESGLAPSEDYMPAAERSRRGQPLSPTRIHWSERVPASSGA